MLLILAFSLVIASVFLIIYRKNKDSIAHNLFELLREMDEEDAGFIITEGCSEEDLGQAVMNRMKKAAAWQIVTT